MLLKTIKMKNKEITKPKAYALIALLAVSVVLASTGVSKLATSLRASQPESQTASITTADGFIKKVNFPNVPISGKAAVVYDVLNKEVLFDKNAEIQLPLASLTKVMMVFVARDILSEDTIVEINSSILSEEGDSRLRDGQKWRLKDIIDLTLVESSNDGAAAIAGAWLAFQKENSSFEGKDGKSAFVEAMNEKVKELGLEQTYFLNETGLDKNEFISGGYGSARDTAKLFSLAVGKFPVTFEATRYSATNVSSIGNTNYKLKNTNSSVEKIPGIIASKTGYTDLAGGNLVIMFDAGLGRPIAISVLGSSKEGRFEDVSALVFATLDYIGSENSDNR